MISIADPSQLSHQLVVDQCTRWMDKHAEAVVMRVPGLFLDLDEVRSGRTSADQGSWRSSA